MKTTGKEDCQTQDRNHWHLPYPLWHIITKGDNGYLTHLLNYISVTMTVTRYSTKY